MGSEMCIRDRKVINCMNEIQKEDHPEAYEPEIVRVYNKKREDE